MAFDCVQEDFMRLTAAAMMREHVGPLKAQEFINTSMETYQRDPSQLITTDADRSFHLVALATNALDYQLPFIRDDAEAERVESRAIAQLAEACELNPQNWDAQRMLAALNATSCDAYLSYLVDHRAEVEAWWASRRGELVQDALAADELVLALQPYLRWLGAIASQALIAGRYRLSYSAACDCLSIAPNDPGDVRRTAVLALAKLECTHEDLVRFRRAHAAAYRQDTSPLRRRNHLAERNADAWMLVAELSCAYRSFDFSGATRALRALLRAYPDAAEPLYYQVELPEGLFARVNVMPGSQDELTYALSEATPLLQEGVGDPDSAGLAVWIATHELVERALGKSQSANADAIRRERHGGEN